MIHLRELQGDDVMEEHVQVIQPAVQDLFGVEEALGRETDRKKIGIRQVLKI
jgi:hypothetical protein